MAEANRAADQMPELADLEPKDQIVRVIAERQRGRQEALLQAERLDRSQTPGPLGSGPWRLRRPKRSKAVQRRVCRRLPQGRT